jgi:hypothetical protein
MTPDPMTAALDQLAAHREHISSLDSREASHFTSLDTQLGQLTGLVTELSRALQTDTAALAQLEALHRQVTELAAHLVSPASNDTARYQPAPPPAWWKLAGADRQEPSAQLHGWVEQVYRPGYGHLAAALAPCWDKHDLCLYGLDILSQLWSALYLQPARSTGLLSAQAEYQARILPALVAQLTAETTGCGHGPADSYHRSTP